VALHCFGAVAHGIDGTLQFVGVNLQAEAA
jgi:hypothetical protein